MGLRAIRRAALVLAIAASSLSAEETRPDQLFNGKDLDGWWELKTENPAKWMALASDKLASKRAKSLKNIPPTPPFTSFGVSAYHEVCVQMMAADPDGRSTWSWPTC